MKKIFILATAAIVAFASCMKSEVVYNQGQQEIGFRQFTGSMTKAEGDPTNLSGLVGGPTTMGVFAHINASDPYQPYFSNAKFVKPTDGKNNWGGDPKRYWPIKDKLDFTLYAPHVEGTTYDNDTKKLTVTVADNTTNQHDFMYGTQRYIGKEKTADGVPVVLKHALSKVSVKIKSNVDNLFKVTKVEIVDSIQNGSFVVTYDGSTSIEMTPGSTKGTVETYSNTTGTDLTTSEEGISFGSKLVFPLAPLAATNAATNAAKLRITYNMEKATGLEAVVDLSDAWESGKHYTYNVTLTATEILLTPTVEDWGNGSTSPIEIK